MRYIYTFFILLGCTFFQNLAEAHDHESIKSGSIHFVPNEGQWDGPFKFKGLHAQADIYLENQGLTIRVGDPQNGTKIHDVKFNKAKEANLKYHTYKINWVNANTNPSIIAAEKQDFIHNYYLGNDS